MKPHISVLTLGVDNLERALAFYRDGLGFPTKGIVGAEHEHGAVAFFHLQPSLMLALWPRTSLAHDTGLEPHRVSTPHVSIGHNVGSSQEVDEIMRRASQAGATIVKPAKTTFYGGYAGYFLDTEGHLWEIVYNPGLANL